VATYGNLVHRVLTFVYRSFDGCVPVPGELDSRSQAVIEQAKNTLNTMDRLLYRCHFKEAIKSAMSLAHEANRYLDEKSPWKIIKQDRQASATALYVAVSVLSCLRTALYPFLPFSSNKLHQFLGFKGSIEGDGWQLRLPLPGQRLLPPEPLFSKLDEGLVAEEAAQLGHTH
jgi:methionyl-tRNA synthetase